MSSFSRRSIESDRAELNANPNHPEAIRLGLAIDEAERKLQDAEAEISGVTIAMALAGCH